MANALSRNRLRELTPGPWGGDMDSLVDHFSGPVGRGVQALYVPASVWEDENSYHVEMDVPGVTRENVDLTYEKGTLRITTERPAPEEARKGLVDERRYGKVTRTVTLPESIDPDSISAGLNNGVLHVTVSKKPEAQPKRIEIRS
ncbi:MAG TPA: Hsp20/alpha crystallin family protein [Lacipirellulaceae bacterium]|nr:Hsp20/alpha crystallin family protein [Lacipirellulaceae bacterium]